MGVCMKKLLHELYYHDLTDSQLSDMKKYCREMKLSLIMFETIDISDISLRYDYVSSFKFSKLEDVIFFKLKYSAGCSK